ncbi:MAG: hypothetical protein M3320_09520 [Actinomycetota bacterium]|nr:hypothetical protein [Actinomycetota bacterium]
MQREARRAPVSDRHSLAPSASRQRLGRRQMSGGRERDGTDYPGIGTVVGTDVHDLDRDGDGDGTACET